ncbi:hypothetical protein KS4_09900 [Poriferisphaera corsica]|uniref:Lipoprotein n=1 Tax=Poriferisphaera corsica TaxID=2528020 RepID=A0A517YRW1_9BACT|nr:hypothetical protein [Poriferisphaera corsica]QDU32951.1 hypothetical protein KS4_09900 [Poriferisphaera corsica]
MRAPKHILTILILSLLLTACNLGPSIKVKSDIGSLKTVTLSGSLTLRPELKQILHEEDWTIQRFGRIEDTTGQIDDYPSIDPANQLPTYHYLDIAAYETKTSDNPQLSIYRIHIRMFGADPNRDIFEIKGIANKNQILENFRSLVSGRYTK